MTTNDEQPPQQDPPREVRGVDTGSGGLPQTFDAGHLQRMVDTMEDGLVVHDASGAIVHFNAAACGILGLSAEQLLGKTSMDPSWRAIRRDGSVFPGNEHPAMRALHSCTPIRGEVMGVSRQGLDLRWIRINATPFDHGKPVTNPMPGISANRGVIVTFTDVTELIVAQRSLDDFFNLSMDIHCIAGVDGFFKRVNPSFTRILGHSADEALSTPFMEFINPLDRAASAEEIGKLQSGGITLNFENRYLTKSGEWRVLSWSCRADIRAGLIYASARDVTEQRATERTLEELMTSLNRTSIVAFTDARGVITEVNDNFCRISGYRRDELIGKTHRVINSGEHSPQFFATMWSTIKAGQLWTGDIKNRAKDGREYWVRTVISPISDRDGVVTRYVAIRFEVTEQKRIEEESRRLAQELQEAQRTAKIGSWTFDMGTGELGWSSEQYRIFEIAEPQEPVELYACYRERLHPGDLPALDEAMARAMEQGEGFTLDHRVLTTDGRTKYVQGIGSVQFDSKGKPIRITGTYQDITARVVLQRSLEIEQSKALHSAKLASLGELAAGVAHEINNPLAIISGTVRALAKVADRPEDLKSRIDTIERAIERVAKIVRGLKKFSRSFDRSELNPHALAEIAREALVLTETRAKRGGAHIELQADSEGVILCDEIEIEQVLVNLINNAVDAVKRRDERWVRVSISETDQQVVLRVTDSGPGIHPSIVGKLFQPFVTTKPPGEGTGLGLSIIKGILDEHHASVGVLPGSPNTCFEIRFPRLSRKKDVA